MSARERTKNMSLEELMNFKVQTMGYGGERMVDSEFQIRQIEALIKSAETNEKLSKRVYALNWFIGLLTAISVALAFSLWINPEWQGLTNFLAEMQ